jgi:phosphate transport system substrate-binding protein
LLAVDAGDGCVLPTRETIANGEYKPLTRPLFIYVDRRALERQEVRAFARYYFENVDELASEVGYVPFPDEHYVQLLDEIPR